MADKPFDELLQELDGQTLFAVRIKSPEALTLMFGSAYDANNPPHYPDDEDQPRIYNNYVIGNILTVQCAWRLQDSDTVIAAYAAADDRDERLAFHLEEITNQAVNTVGVRLPGYDLLIEFADGVTLSIFCGNTNDTNWFFAKIFQNSSIFYRVDARSTLQHIGRVFGDLAELT